MPPSGPPPSPAASSHEDALLATIMAFVNSPDWPGARAILDAHPELLSPLADRTLSTLLMSVETAGDADTAAVLALHLELLRLVREAGADEAFRQIEEAADTHAQEELLDAIVNNTIAVLTQLPARLTDWQAALESIRAEADAAGDQPLLKLTGATLDLLAGDDPQTPNLPPGSLHRAAWDAIVGGLVDYARNAAQNDMFAVIEHNVRHALAGGQPDAAYWASYFANVQQMADDLADPGLAALSAALVELLESGSAEGLKPDLEGAHAACWQAIVGGLSPASGGEGA